MIISINKPVLKTTLTKIESQVYQTNYDSHQQVYHNLNENKSKLLKTNFFIEKGNHDMLLPQRRCSHLMFYVKRGSPCEINYHLPLLFVTTFHGQWLFYSAQNPTKENRTFPFCRDAMGHYLGFNVSLDL